MLKKLNLIFTPNNQRLRIEPKYTSTYFFGSNMRPFNRITWADSFTCALKVDRRSAPSHTSGGSILHLCVTNKETHKAIVNQKAASIILRYNYTCHQLLSELPQQDLWNFAGRETMPMREEKPVVPHYTIFLGAP